MTFLKITGIELAGKRVLVREDLNVPINDGVITSDARLIAALPTLRAIIDAGGKLAIMSHLGRPKEGVVDAKYSLAPIATYLGKALHKPVRLVSDYLSGITWQHDEVLLLENVRFCKGENDNDETLARQLASLCDVFVNDAFATAHRAQASTHGVARFAPIACAGPLLVAELDALSKVLEKPKHPVVAIIGGAKISTKLPILKHLVAKVDQLIIGGGMANTLLAAQGHAIGASLYEKDLLPEARSFLASAKESTAEIVLPSDVVVSKALDDTASIAHKSIDAISPDDKIFDIGAHSLAKITAILQHARTIVWNGPVGVFEHPPFHQGTLQIAQAIAQSSAFSMAGGGETIAAIEQSSLTEKISYISTGGGAFLECLEGRVLPAVAILMERSLTLSLKKRD